MCLLSFRNEEKHRSLKKKFSSKKICYNRNGEEELKLVILKKMFFSMHNLKIAWQSLNMKQPHA